MTGHPEAAGIIDNDQIGTALFDKFGADPRPSPGGNDGLIGIEGSLQAIAHLLLGVGVSYPVHGFGIVVVG